MWVIDLQKSGTVPGVGMVHAPFSLIPALFSEDHFREACELAPIFNELFDRVSLDAKFLQDSLSRFVFAILTVWLLYIAKLSFVLLLHLLYLSASYCTCTFPHLALLITGVEN